jgi:hypothetical protein
MTRTLVLVPLLLPVFLTVTLAQTSNTSELQGTVTAQTAGVAVGAVVTIGNEAGWSSTMTDERGRYAFKLLAPGTYTVTITAQGFKEFSAQVRLRPQAAASLNASLKLAFSTQLEVTETTRDPRRNASSMTLTARDIAALPDDPNLLMERLMMLAGGVRPGDVSVYVDGFREYTRLPPKATISMIRINSNPFSAEFSDRSSKRIEITTKPGSDTFHGDANLKGRSSALDTRNPLADSKPPMRYLNYSGYLQGPIVKGHLDFLAYGGLWQQDENAVVHATTLDAARRFAQPFDTTVPTPMRDQSVLLKTDFQFLNQLVNATFSHTTDTRGNQGLDGGLDLPERAFDSSSTDDVGRMWWTWVGKKSLNDARFEITRHRDQSTPLLSTPSVLVLDAFNGGGNQSANIQTSSAGFQAIDALTVQAGAHTWKAGIQFVSTTRNSVDSSGFGGTFTFGAAVERDANGRPLLDSAGQPISISPIENYRRVLLGVPGYHPSQFSIVAGNPQVGVSQWGLGWFVLDDWPISKQVSLSYGIRQELQNNIRASWNLAPRAYLSWLLDPEGANSIKAGAGVFYSNVDPDITFETRRLDGTHQRQLVVNDPLFFSTIPASLTASSTIGPTTYTKSPDLVTPRSLRTSIAYERQLPWNVWGVVQYDYAMGLDLLRSLNINAPLPGSSGPIQPPAFQYQSTGRSSERELLLALRGSINQSTFYVNYTLARRYGDTDGASTLPSNSYDLSGEWGPLANDRRRDFVAGATFSIPEDVYVSPYLTITSGRRFNITTGRDDNNDSVFTDRPAFARPGDPNAVATPYGLLNPNPRPGDLIIPRNLGLEPTQTTMNVALSKTFFQGFVISINMENLLNAVRLYDINGVITSPSFGLPNRALNGRRIELGVRYTF